MLAPTDGMLCGDLMFSGHTMVTLTLVVVVLHLSRTNPWWGVPIVALEGFGLIVTRMHYTSDVIVAVFVCGVVVTVNMVQVGWYVVASPRRAPHTGPVNTAVPVRIHQPSIYASPNADHRGIPFDKMSLRFSGGLRLKN